MTERRATITDVARMAGVSIKTVSRVFNRQPHVRPATREAVIAAADALSYRPNLSARQLASNLTFVVGMLYDNPNSDYITGVQHGSLQICREHGYNLLIHPCKASAPNLIDEVLELSRQVDGLILYQPVSDIQELCQTLLERGVACVRVSQRPFKGIPWVSVGDLEAAGRMTEHLLQLGHREIGFIVGHPDHGSSHDRLRGYCNALESYGIEFKESLVEQGQFDFESGYVCARKLLSLEPRPTAIFASNDPMAMGVLSAAHSMKIEIPAQLSVAGFDDSPLARHAWPPLTTVRQPIADVARRAMEMLMLKLKVVTGDEKFEERLRADLVHRESTSAHSG